MAVLMQGRRVFVLLLCLIVFISAAKPARAQDASSLQLYEQKIKAGLIYNFLKYTEWPAEMVAQGAGHINVCIYGTDDPFGGYLDPIQERTVHQRPIKVIHVSHPPDAVSCNLLFIEASEKEAWPELREALASKSVLTVGDFDGFSEGGGMIRLGNKDNKIYVGLNVDAIALGHLRIYDSLRRLSAVTHTNPGRGQ